MDGDQNLISIAMNSNCIIEILVLIVRGELDIYVFGNARWYHAFLVVFYLEIWSRGRKNMQSLWGRRVVN